mmetsp:Transcript_6515/g.14287  ORF Transcript_6515/g.14287 Transcript_6515/m.14287 type:complete len:204 (-) Transcript_6515:172-783(-)
MYDAMMTPHFTVASYTLTVLLVASTHALIGDRLASTPPAACTSMPRSSEADAVPRRALLATAFTACTAILSAPTIVSAADEQTSDDALCPQPPKKQLKKLSDTRSQIDMAVQASSVQAWSSAAEIVNDPLLDASSLSMLLDSCSSVGGTGSNSREQRAADILQAIASMRDSLNGQEKVTTEDAMAIMKYGTSARSNLDTLFES